MPEQRPVSRRASVPPPRLLVAWEPARRTLLGNLGDLFRRPAPPLRLTSRPAPFWPDVFVNTRVPRRGLPPSVALHIAGLALLIAFPGLWLKMNPPQPSPFAERSITYYEVSEYLPRLESPGARGRVERPPEPAYARQPIVSLPPEPDNFRQTIINPEAPQILHQHVPLPNLVVWTPVPAAVPVAALARNPAQLPMPVMEVQAVQARAANVEREVAALRLPTLPAPAVVAPPVSEDALRRQLGDMNIARLEPQATAPSLPVGEQRAASAEGEPAAVAPPPPPRVAGEGVGQGAGRLLAVSIDPIAAGGVPIRLPAGSRRGAFAAGPEGTPGAAGTPGSRGSGEATFGSGTGGEAGPGGGDGDLPPGIFIGGPGAPGAAVVAALPAGPPPAVARPRPPVTSAPLIAAARRPTLADLARETAPGATPELAGPPPSALESEVFGGKKYYSMMMNMPNLTSAAGSWIVRFAELHETPGPGDLTAPVAMNKVDPAYPSDLIRARVEGVVVLYAVIGRDGVVSEIRVLRGVNDRLDESARRALARWRFRPATKNGAAVDLEAVVQIPFVAGRAAF